MIIKLQQARRIINCGLCARAVYPFSESLRVVPGFEQSCAVDIITILSLQQARNECEARPRVESQCKRGECDIWTALVSCKSMLACNDQTPSQHC